MPVKRMTEIFHKYGVIVLIDGAHTPGQLTVDYADIDADFYTGNNLKFLSNILLFGSFISALLFTVLSISTFSKSKP